MGVHAFLCKHAFLCVSACWGAPAWSGVLLLCLGLCGSLWSGVDLVGLSSGAQTMPVQDYPPRDKVCDYHEKTASSSLIAKDCQACWRGGPPLISCRDTLNAGAHSPPYTHTQGNTMTHTHRGTRMLMLIHMCTYSHVICAGIHTYTIMKLLSFMHIWACGQMGILTYLLFVWWMQRNAAGSD